MTKDPVAALAAATDNLVAAANMAESTSSKSAATERVPSPPLVFIQNSWLNDLTARIRSRPIPWEGYQRADLVSAEELKLIKKVDAKGVGAGRGADVAKISESDAPEYALLYLRLLAKLSRTDTLQQILVLVGDMLQDRDDRVDFFLQATSQTSSASTSTSESQSQNLHQTLPWGPFLKLLDAQDEFVQLKSAQFLILLLLKDKASTAPPQALPRVCSFLSAIINAPFSSSTSSSGSGSLAPSAASYADGNGADVGVQLFESLLRNPKYRRLIWEQEVSQIGQTQVQDEQQQQQQQQGQANRESSINGLLNILRTSVVNGSSGVSAGPGSNAASGSATPNGTRNGSAAQITASSAGAAAQPSSGARTPAGQNVGPQMQYQSIFCLWLLTFDEDVAENFNVKFPLVQIITDVAKNAIKEKVVRILISTFRNLLVKAPETNGRALLGAKVLPLAESLAARKWSDEEIDEDLQFIIEELKHKLKGMSTYDVYVSELASGQLTWDSPLHELEEFWRDNTPKLLEDNAAQLNKLIKMIQESSDPTTLAVGCSDLGKIVSASETAKRHVNDSSVKVRVMDLMSHPDSDVKYRALHTVSKLVSASWR